MIVLDSSFLIAYHNARDVHHAAAAGAMRSLVGGAWGRVLLLEYVFLEVVTVLLARRGLAVASEVARKPLQAREVEFVPCSDLFLDTLEMFYHRKTPTRHRKSNLDRLCEHGGHPDRAGPALGG